jgi:fibronectin-binding autotransporter adhesin
MHRFGFTTVRAAFATVLVGGLFSVAAVAALPALPAAAGAPATPPNCTDIWNVTASGTYSWNTPGDWSTRSVPGTGDVACINKGGTYTVQLIGGTTTVDALVVGSGTPGDQETLQVEGTCSNNATLDTNNTAFTPDSDAIASTGRVLLGSTGCGNSAALGIGTSLAVSAGGVLEADAGVGGTRLISGNVTNDGTTNIDEDTEYSSGTWDNAGALNLADSTSFTAESGTPAATFTDDTGGSVTSSGTNQTGQLVIDGGNTYNQGNGTTSGEPVFLPAGSSGPSIALHYTGNGASTVETQGTGTLDGTISSGQTLEINGTCSNNAVETEDASLTSNGSVQLTSSGCGNNSSLAVSSGFTFTNGSNGVLQADAGDGGTRLISGDVTNDGTTNIDEGTEYSAGTWDNDGPLNLATGDTLTAVTGTPIATFTDDTGGSVTSTASGTGQLVIDGGNTYNQGNGTTTGEPVFLSTGSSGPSIALHYTGNGSSTVETEGTGTLDGNIAHGQTLEITGTCSNNAVETEDASLTSNGSVQLTSSGCGNNSSLVVGSRFTFTNGSHGVIQSDSGDGGTHLISGKVTSDGTTNIEENTQYSAGTWDNSGPLDLATGDTLTAVTGTPIATFTDDTGGSVTSTASGTGQLVIDGGNTYNQGNGTTSGEPVFLSTGSSGPSIALHYTGTGASTVETEGTGTLDGTISSGQTLEINGTCSNNAAETLDKSIAVSGTIQLTSSGCGNASSLVTPKKLLLTVNKTGQLDAIAGDGGSRAVSGNVTNQGKVNIDEATTYTPLKKGTFTNEGKIDIATGLDLELASANKSVFLNTTKGVITGAGQLVVNSEDTFDQGAGKITGTPVFVYTANSATAATLDISGSGKGSIDVEGSTNFKGNIAKGQTVNVLGTCSLNAALTGSANVTNAGTLNLSNVNCGNATAFVLPAGDTLTNSATGVIETLQGDGGGTRTITANVTNDGTIGPSGDNALTIDGNLADGSTAVFDANVSSSSSDLITLGAGDTATLGGSLVAVPVSGFTPTSGYSTTVVSGTYSGTFSSVGPTGWSVSYPTGSVTLKFT